MIAYHRILDNHSPTLARISRSPPCRRVLDVVVVVVAAVVVAAFAP